MGTPGVSDGKGDALARLLSTPEGKRLLAESMVRPVRGPGRECPVCGYPTHDMVAHCSGAGDDAHRVAEVMES